MNKTEPETLIILIITSITLTGFAMFYAIKRAKRIKNLPLELRKKEIEKDNNRESLGLFLKDIFEAIQIFLK